MTLRVQLTLVAGGRGSPIPPQEFQTTLSASGRRFPARVLPLSTLEPGGPAVHCDVALPEAADARSYFPAGTHFEVWEGGRTGYGQVLAQLN